MSTQKDYIRWIRSKVGREKVILVFAGGCIFKETLELKWFSLAEEPELFCKQHEETWRDIKSGVKGNGSEEKQWN